MHPRDWPDALDGATHEPWDEREASGWLVARNEAAPWSPARLGPTRKEPILGTREWARYQANMARPQSPNALRMHAHALETAGEGGAAGFGGGGEGGGGPPSLLEVAEELLVQVEQEQVLHQVVEDLEI